MHVLFVEPRFPQNQMEFVRALAKAGARVTAIGEAPRAALGSRLEGWLYGYEQVPSVADRKRRLGILGERDAVHDRQAFGVDQRETVG